MVRQVLRWLRGVAAVVVSLCAPAGAARLVVPATAGAAGESAGVRRQLAFPRALDAAFDVIVNGASIVWSMPSSHSDRVVFPVFSAHPHSPSALSLCAWAGCSVVHDTSETDSGGR